MVRIKSLINNKTVTVCAVYGVFSICEPCSFYGGAPQDGRTENGKHIHHQSNRSAVVNVEVSLNVSPDV